MRGGVPFLNVAVVTAMISGEEGAGLSAEVVVGLALKRRPLNWKRHETSTPAEPDVGSQPNQ
jgi:hypothetical protein